MQASESRLRDATGSQIAGSSSGFNALMAYRNEVEGFCATIRNGRPNLCDGPTAMAACVPILKGNESIKAGQKLEIGPELYYSS